MFNFIDRFFKELSPPTMEEISEDKFCISCKYFRSPMMYPVPKCVHPSNGRSPISGEVTMLNCSNLRSSRGPCGPDGKNYVKR